MSDRLDQLSKLHDTDPHDPFVTYGIALEHAKADRLDDAIAWLDKTIEMDPHYHYAYFQKAKLLAEKGDDARALAVVDHGIEMATKAGDAKALGELRELREAM